jgi:hypothetical protein
MTQRLDVHPDDLLPQWMDGNDERSDVDDDDDDGDADATDAVDELEDGDRDVTITADVVAVDADQPSSIDHKATLEAETGTIDAVVWDDAKQFVEGDAVTVSKASVGEFKGEPQLNVNEQTTLEKHQAAVEPEKHRETETDTATATDGGEQDTQDDDRDYEGIKPGVMKAVTQYDSGEQIDVLEFANSLDDVDDIDQIVDCLENIATGTKHPPIKQIDKGEFERI